MKSAELCLTFFILLFAARSIPVQAQPPVTSAPRGSFNVSILNIDLAYEGIKGTPYFSKDWSSGTVKFVDKKVLSNNVKLNIDFVKQALLFQIKDGTVGTFQSELLDQIQVFHENGDTSVFKVFRTYQVEGGKLHQPKFYEVLADHPVMILKLTNKVFRKADYKGAYSDNTPYDEYLDQFHYFVQISNGRFQKFKLKENSVIKALGQDEQWIKSIITQEQLDLSDEKDLIRLLQLLNTAKP